jgi:hypothetical protein
VFPGEPGSEFEPIPGGQGEGSSQDQEVILGPDVENLFTDFSDCSSAIASIKDGYKDSLFVLDEQFKSLSLLDTPAGRQLGFKRLTKPDSALAFSFGSPQQPMQPFGLVEGSANEAAIGVNFEVQTVLDFGALSQGGMMIFPGEPNTPMSESFPDNGGASNASPKLSFGIKSRGAVDFTTKILRNEFAMTFAMTGGPTMKLNSRTLFAGGDLPSVDTRVEADLSGSEPDQQGAFWWMLSSRFVSANELLIRVQTSGIEGGEVTIPAVSQSYRLKLEESGRCTIEPKKP